MFVKRERRQGGVTLELSSFIVEHGAGRRESVPNARLLRTPALPTQASTHSSQKDLPSSSLYRRS